MQFDSLTRAEVLEQLFKRWQPLQESLSVAVDEAVGYLCFADLFSKNVQPVHRASCMDGIAVASQMFAHEMPDTSKFEEGRDYQRADTGDDFSDDFDTVIRIEDVSFITGGGIVLDNDISLVAGQNVDTRGAALDTSDLLLPKGWKIRPVDVATLVRGGITMVEVVRPPHICFIPTGNELVAAGVQPKRGQQIDCNSALARHMLASMGAKVTTLAIAKDSLEELYEALDSALQQADIVIINGGSSKGRDDYNARLLKQRGELLNHGAAAAPGRPLAIAMIDDKPVVNVPGPMVACCYVFDWCLRAIIARALGSETPRHPVVQARLTAEISGCQGMEFWNRVDLRKTANGYEAEPISLHRNGGLYRIGITSGQIISSPDGATYPAGSLVDVEILCDPAYLPYSSKSEGI